MTRMRVATRIAFSVLFVPLAAAVPACSGSSPASRGGSPLAPEVGPGFVATGAPAGPAAGAPAASAKRLPWHIAATVATTPAEAPEGCIAYLTSVIEGTATHAGRISGTGSTCIIDQIAPDPNPPFLPAGPPPYVTAQFTNPLWTLTTASGDEIWTEGVDAVAVISLADGSLAARGTQRIIGGTGRFEGATGEAQVGGVNDDGQGPDDLSGRGWIQFR
jgi:hypothetical protein